MKPVIFVLCIYKSSTNKQQSSAARADGELVELCHVDLLEVARALSPSPVAL